MYPGAVDIDTIIPSISTVQAAKEKRDRLRKMGAIGDDYISLSLTQRDDIPQGPHPESRLMREEDELGEGDDGASCNLVVFNRNGLLSAIPEFAEYTSAQDRIALGKKSRKVEAQKRRAEMSEMILDACVLEHINIKAAANL